MRTGALPLQAASPFRGEVATRSGAAGGRVAITIGQYHPFMLNPSREPFPVAAEGAVTQMDCATSIAIW
jgi:hypothetical protein